MGVHNTPVQGRSKFSNGGGINVLFSQYTKKDNTFDEKSRKTYYLNFVRPAKRCLPLLDPPAWMPMIFQLIYRQMIQFQWWKKVSSWVL